jgi:hypothetical protein
VPDKPTPLFSRVVVALDGLNRDFGRVGRVGDHGASRAALCGHGGLYVRLDGHIQRIEKLEVDLLERPCFKAF